MFKDAMNKAMEGSPDAPKKKSFLGFDDEEENTDGE